MHLLTSPLISVTTGNKVLLHIMFVIHKPYFKLSSFADAHANETKVPPKYITETSDIHNHQSERASTR